MIISRDWQEVSVLECILSGLHIGVDVEPEPERAWIRMKKSKVDAVIVDCDTAGSEPFLRLLRSQNVGPAPVVIASGSPNRRGMDRTGANFVVQKPVSVEQAVHTLSAARNMILNERLRYYRQSLNLPVWLTRSSGKRFKARIINVSQGGTKIAGGQQLSFAEDVRLNFALPGNKLPIRAEGKVAWSDKEGGAGIRFVQIEQRLQRKLQLWVEKKYFQIHNLSHSH